MADRRRRDIYESYPEQSDDYYTQNGDTYEEVDDYTRTDNSVPNSLEPPWAGSVSEKGDVFYLETPEQPPEEPETSKVSNGDAHNGSVPNGDSRRSKKKGKGKKNNYQANNHVNLQSHGVTFNDVPTGVTKEVTLLVDPARNNYGRRATLCESLFGIVPGHFNARHNGSSQTDKRIMVQGLLPGGEAIKHGIKIGEWLVSINDYDVDFDNIDSFLSAIQGPLEVTLTLQKIAIQTSPKPTMVKKNNVINNNLVKLVSGERLNEEPLTLDGVSHGILYLTMDCHSEDMQGKEDVLYQFPGQDTKLVDIRGMFITLGHMLVDVTNNTAKNSTLLVNDQLVNVGYCRENREIMVLTMPSNRISMVQLNLILDDAVRILKILYGSLHSAFSRRDNHKSLNHFFALLFQRFLLSKELLKTGAQQTEYLEPFTDLLPGVRSLSIPEETKVVVNNCLSEFEAADFCDMSDEYYNIRRSYNILGSCLYYKGYLLANHLHHEDLLDINLYLTYYCLLTLCNEEQLGSLLVWKEIFPTRRCFKQVDPLIPGYTEPEARWFLMVVGMKNALMGMLFEAGGCASWAEGSPTPDPFYVDQAKATLLQMESHDVFNHCEIRLQGPAVPSLACTDWFLPSHKNKDESSSPLSLLKPSTSPKTTVPPKKSQPESILKKRNSSEGYRHGRTMYDMDSDADSLSTGTSEGSAPGIDRRRRPSVGSDESGESGSSSNIFKGSRKRRNLLSVFDVSDMKKGLPTGVEEGSHVKITSGCDNTLFHYIHLDKTEGILLCPSQQELAQVTTSLHNKVLLNFHQACFVIRKGFAHSIKTKDMSESGNSSKFGIDDGLGDVLEQGILFHCTPDSHESKKNPPVLSYWVVGRMMRHPFPKEFYVCFHDSVQQNLVEMAFKLGFGVHV